MKRQKPSSRGLSLSQLLPAPKHAAAGGGRRLDVLGSGDGAAEAGSAGGAGNKKGLPRRRGKYDSDDEEVVPGSEDPAGMVNLAPGRWCCRGVAVCGWVGTAAWECVGVCGWPQGCGWLGAVGTAQVLWVGASLPPLLVCLFAGSLPALPRCSPLL